MKAGALLGLDPQSLARLRAVTGHVEINQATLEDIASDGRRSRQRRAGVIEAEADDDEAES